MKILGLWNYWAFVVMMMTGLYIVMSRENLIKKMMGINIFQVSVILFYISMGKVRGGTAPIIVEQAEGVLYSNPLPQVLMLTAIVVGVATTAVGLSLAVRIGESYGSLKERDIVDMDREAEREEAESARAGEGR
jgi:multicomponent Na+:H+ antiporter subunit C